MDVCFLETDLKKIHMCCLSSDLKFASKPAMQAIRCTSANCNCDCFQPTKLHLRSCSFCKHGWVAHALDKLGLCHVFNCHQVEMVQPSIAFDIASLMLYGTQAIPVRLKILLDRLFSVLAHDDVIQVLHGFGWTYEDYVRGYILQDSSGNVLDRWSLATREEEPLILQQFLRFGETKAIAQHLLMQENVEKPEFSPQPPPKAESDIKKFIERTNRVASSTMLKQSSGFTNSTLVPVSRPCLLRQTSSSSHSLTPPSASPVNCTSPVSVSPLNKLQNMQPFDYRREKSSPDVRTNDQPQNTPLSSPTSSIPSSVNHIATSTTTTATTTLATVQSDYSITDGGSDDDTNVAINLSQNHVVNHMDSIFAARKVRHLRKSANPMRRRWNPMVLSTLATNPSTGKKRVQCHVCFKTFCDKGALKIHFSAVHLREMHKCTVEGCNMMFSSRRSRNRHSANPNPKLHTPNMRRKINPHDGRTANPFPLIPPSAIIYSSNNSVVPPSLPAILDSERHSYMTDVSTKPLSRSAPGSLELQSSHERSLDNSPLPAEDVAIPLTKKCKMEESDRDADISNGCEESGINLSMKDEQMNKGVRKRKSMNPIKCAVTSDEDLLYVTTDDDSSSDTFIDNLDDDDGLLGSKSDDLSSDLGDDSKDDITFDKDETSGERFLSSITRRTQEQRYVFPALAYDHFKKMSEKEQELKEEFHKRGGLDNGSSEQEISENPLRHLETLSMGAFANLTVSSSRPHLNPTSSGISFHAPGLGLASSANENSRDVPASNASVVTSAGADPDSYSDHQIAVMPSFRDASMIGAIEVPVDKENPRKCTACGKIFQNHFGVKTHYQNVHLKLMHKCTVEGCNAAFPSKRSRDRHSANLNLHRKLLSTSGDKVSPFLDKGPLYPFHHSTAAGLREEFFSRFYDPQNLPLNFAELYQGRLPCSPEGLVTFPNHLGSGHLGALPFHPTFLAPSASGHFPEMLGIPGGVSGRDTPSSSVSTTPPSPRPATPKSTTQNVTLDEDLEADSEGKFGCEFCPKKFHENVVLREHYEKSHTRELFRCSVDGCDKAFTSKKNCNIHCDNEQLHKKEKMAAS